MRGAADATAQLVQLGESEALGVFDDHDRRVRDVDADFDDRRRDEDVELPAREGVHDPIFVVRLHPAVQERDSIGREDVLLQVIGHFGGRPEIDLCRFLDERVDDVGLPAEIELLPHELVDLVPPRFGFGDRLDRLSARWHLPHHGDVEIAVGRERQRARNRRGRHHQDVRMHAFRAQRGALHDAEAVLLVDDRQAQLSELDRFFDEGVRADDEVQRAAGELGLRLRRFLAGVVPVKSAMRNRDDSSSRRMLM